MKDLKIIIHTDGGSRGNPGPAACAFVSEKGDETLFKGSKFLGKQTNNFAEYQGVILALEWLMSSPLVSDKNILITFALDSELVVKQINGLYKVKDETLKKLYLEIKNLINQTGQKISFHHVPRIENKIADLLVNEELDRNT